MSSFIQKIKKKVTGKKNKESQDDSGRDRSAASTEKTEEFKKMEEKVKQKLKKLEVEDSDDEGEDEQDEEMRHHINALEEKKEKRKRDLLEWEKQQQKGLSVDTEAQDKRKEALLERELKDYETKEKIVSSKEMEKAKRQLLSKIWQEEKDLSVGINEIQIRKDKSKEALLASISTLETHCQNLIEKIAKWQEMQRKDLGQFLIDEDNAYQEVMRQREGSLHMKRSQIVDAMIKAMEWEKIKSQQKNYLKDLNQNDLRNQIIQQEQLQKHAFEVLQLERDTSHRLILSQIALVHQELAAISSVEMQKKIIASEIRLKEIEEQRKVLAKLLSDLVQQKEIRERQLREQLERMDESSSSDENFWLLQYQWLLEHQPLAIQMELLGIDDRLKRILLSIARNNPDMLLNNYLQHLSLLSYDQLIQMSEKQLYQAGLDNHDLCRQLCLRLNDSQIATAPEEQEELSINENTKLWCQNECVICLDQKSAIIFLPCGHVCTCVACASKIPDCPLCRVPIKAKFDVDPNQLNDLK